MVVDAERQDLQATFAEELAERVRDLGALLMRLEQGEGSDLGRGELLGSLFREAHSLKGAARAVEIQDVERLAHALETALTAAQRYGLQPAGAWFDAVYRAIDTLDLVYRATIAGGSEAALDYSSVLNGLSVDPGQTPAASAKELVVLAQPSLPQVKSAIVTGTAPPASETVRVAVNKLDTLLALAGELSVAQIRVEQRLRDLQELRQGLDEWRREWRGTRSYHTNLGRVSSNGDLLDRKGAQQLEGLLRLVERADRRAQTLFQQTETVAAALAQDTAQLGLISRDLESEVMAVRLTPVATIFGPFERLVRDLARAQDKAIQLILEGGDTEIDRKILERLRDPLMHMIRNAVDHGIENPVERQARGKSATGTLRLTASHRGGLIAIEVKDDGVGLDLRRIRDAAVGKGFLTKDQADAADDKSLIDLIFRPGFSTRSIVTETSGRGVGMDIVREHVESLHGHIEAVSFPGQGTSFTMVIPLTLATTRAILVEQSGQIFGVPSAIVERTSRVREEQFIQIDGQRTIQIEQRPVVAIELRDVLHLQL